MENYCISIVNNFLMKLKQILYFCFYAKRSQLSLLQTRWPEILFVRNASYFAVIYNIIVINFFSSKVDYSFKSEWSKFFTLASHFSKLFELAGLSRLEIVPNHGVLQKKEKVFTWNRWSLIFLFLSQCRGVL